MSDSTAIRGAASALAHVAPPRDAPSIDAQRTYWNAWNAQYREISLEAISTRQAEVVKAWLDRMQRTDLDIADVGCGAGWMTQQLTSYGRAVGFDFADQVLERARRRCPNARFVTGDFMAMNLPEASFDVAVTLEMLSHIDDQPAFMRRLAAMLRPGGRVMIATQNRPVLETNALPARAPGQLRKWVDCDELRALMAPHFDVQELFTVTPASRRGLQRILNAGRVERAMRKLTGGGYARLKERLGMPGWTIMALGRRRPF